jgi:hypothetical protein
MFILDHSIGEYLIHAYEKLHMERPFKTKI